MPRLPLRSKRTVRVAVTASATSSPSSSMPSVTRQVPGSTSQPVSVPPEMLLLPETLWNSAAPIIESVSPKEAEIGAEVIIRGHNFAAEGLDSKTALKLVAKERDDTTGKTRK